MRNWIQDFYNTYKARTSRDVVIYTTAELVEPPAPATGAGRGAPARCGWPAGRARAGTLPTGCAVWTFWQYTSTGSVAGISGNVDRDYFNGSSDRLLALANNT